MQRRGQRLARENFDGYVDGLQCFVWTYEGGKIEIDVYNENECLVAFGADFAGTEDAAKKLEVPMLPVTLERFRTLLEKRELSLGFTGLIDDKVQTMDIVHRDAFSVTLRRLPPMEALSMAISFVDTFHYKRSTSVRLFPVGTIQLPTAARELN